MPWGDYVYVNDQVDFASRCRAGDKQCGVAFRTSPVGESMAVAMRHILEMLEEVGVWRDPRALSQRTICRKCGQLADW